MKSSLKITFIALAMSVSMSAFAQDAIALKRTYTNGAVEKYTLTSNVTTSTDLSSMGQDVMEMAVNTSSDLTFTFSNPKEDGTVSLKFLLSNMNVKMEGPMAEMMSGGQEMPKELGGTAKLDALYQVSDVKVDGGGGGAMAMMTGGMSPISIFQFFALPKDPVKVGDTWNFELKGMEMFEKNYKMTAKLVGEAKVQEIDAWQINVSGSPKMNLDLSKMMAEGGGGAQGMGDMKMMLEGTTKTLTKVFLSKATGQIVMIDSAYESTAEVKLPDMGVSFPSNSQGISKLVIKK